MKPRPATWGEVHTDFYVRDPKDNTWRVKAVRPSKDPGRDFLLVNAKDQQVMVTKRDAEPVTLLEVTEDEALAIVQERLGATVLVQHERGKVAVCPPLTKSLEAVHSHLFLMHGQYTRTGPGSKSIERLIELHVTDHTNEDPHQRSHAWIDHTHPARTRGDRP